MKKKCFVRGDLWCHLKRLLLIMKLTILIFLMGFMSVSASVYSQATKLTMHLERVSLSDIIHQIEEQTEFVFLYEDCVVDQDKIVNVEADDSTVDEILDIVLKDTGVKYEIIKKQIILTTDKTLQKKDIKHIKEEIEELQTPKKNISGSVKDSKGGPIPGATIIVKGKTIGTVTDYEGNFNLDVPEDSKIIVVSFVGYVPQEIEIGSKTNFAVTLEENTVGIEEVVAVGYGMQKKASLVGSITTTSSKELQRTGGVTNLAQTLTGNLPGVTTIQVNSQPGASDPEIYIRGQSTWNNTQPYILVDGVERRMNDIDVNEIETISVLKDASATAVYGVKGANGVILITTKRGSKGKPQITVSANTTMKVPSLLIDKLDAYDALWIENAAIERESVVNSGSWSDYTPPTIIERYRNQENLKYPEAYPNINWQDYLLKDAAFDTRVNVNASGGNSVAKYFTSLSYLNEADMFKQTQFIDEDFKPGYSYDRFNLRANLDINVTPSTALSINLAGIYGSRKASDYLSIDYVLSSLYSTASNLLMPVYEDGILGYNPETTTNNPYDNLATKTYYKYKTTQVTSDVILNQKLDFVTKGLSALLKFSFDNSFNAVSTYVGPDLNVTKYIDPAIEDALPGTEDQYIYTQVRTNNNFAFYRRPWGLKEETADISSIARRLYYQAQLNYSREFGKHDVGATGVFTREQMATGSEFEWYREDWIFRATYGFDNRYLAEFNGAYNGSEKFGEGYRFAFFPSVGLGWSIKNEKFLEGQKWLDRLKLRYNFGFIGDDGISSRWLYMSQYEYGGNLALGEDFRTKSPYTIYKQTVTGNPDIHWEKAQKINYGLDFTALNSLISVSFDLFEEKRTDILISGDSRVLPAYYSIYIPTANVGKVDKKGYEFVLSSKKNINNDLYLWGNISVTHVKDKVIFKEEPQLKDPHLLAAGFALNQTKTVISDGFMTNWDEIYATPSYSVNDGYKLPGDMSVIDYDADGIYDGSKDAAPYGYSNIPQNTYSATVGANYKNWNIMLQFYGVNNVTRNTSRSNFNNSTDIAYAHALDYWSVDNPSGESFLPRWAAPGQMTANYYLVDGSYCRLKNAEIAYNFSGGILRKLTVSSLRIYLNGNNLLFWSKELPDDREYGYGSSYPSVKRFNFGVDIKF